MEQKKSPEKDYRRQSPQYFLIGLIVALSTTLLAFEYRTFEEIEQDFDPPGVIIDPYIDDLPPVTVRENDVKPDPPKPPQPPVPSPDPVPDPEPIPHPIIPDPIHLEPGIPFIDPDPEPLAPEGPSRIVEVMPEFPGGMEEMQSYLRKSLKYPALAQENGIESKLFVQFIVNSDGSITDVEILNPQGVGFDKEAKRVISGMPKWKPGKQGGKTVRVYYIIPINFTLK